MKMSYLITNLRQSKNGFAEQPLADGVLGEDLLRPPHHVVGVQVGEHVKLR